MFVKDFDKIGAFLKSELIGLEVEVTDYSNKDLIGLKGVVVDETKNMLHIDVSGVEIKKISKGHAIFVFSKGSEKYVINGNDLISRPWDRVKKKWQKKRW